MCAPQVVVFIASCSHGTIRAFALQVEKDYLENPSFTPDNIRTKSGAAAGLCNWVINICKYFRIFQVALTSDVAHAADWPATKRVKYLRPLLIVVFAVSICAWTME